MEGYAIKLEPIGSFYAIKLDGSLEAYQKEVGGYIETIPTTSIPFILLINEEGKLRHLPENILATKLTPLKMDYIVGNALLVKAGPEDIELLTEAEAEDICKNLSRLAFYIFED